MSKNTLNEAIRFALDDILRRGIKIEKSEEFSADLDNKIIYIQEDIEPSPMYYFLLRHELYHFTVFPKTTENRDNIIKKASSIVSAEFFEERYILRVAYSVLSNAIVNKYGMLYDPYKKLFEDGHEEWLSNIYLEKGMTKSLRLYIKLLNDDLVYTGDTEADNIVSKLVDAYIFLALIF